MRLAYKWQAAIVVAIGLFMAVLDNTIVSVALPQMQHAFHTDFETITWVATAYFLAQAAVIPVTGYLSDLLGSKTIFIVALVLFTIGSGLCAIAPTKELLIAFRVLQGIGGGALFPLAFAIIFRVFPPAERGPASAVISVPVLLAPAFGPTAGGFLTTTFDWSAIFIVNLPIGVIAVILSLLVLRGRSAEQAEMGGAPIERGKGFDVVGLALAILGFSALVYGITEAGTKGWGNRTVDTFLGVGVVLLIGFVINELRVRDPVMDLRLFGNYTFTISNVLLWSLGAFLFGSLFLLPFFFENIQGQTALTAGEILISQGLSAAVAVVFAGRLYNRVGPRWLAALGFLLITVATFGLTQFNVNTTGASLQGWLILRGLGLGLTNIPLQTLAVAVVSNRAMARASSLVNVTRQVFAAIGVSALTTLLTQQTTSHVPSATAAFKTGPLATAQAQCVAQFGRNVPAIQACVSQFAHRAGPTYVFQHAATAGLNNTFVVVMIGCGLSALLALIVGRDPAIQAAKAATARGEQAERHPAVVGE